MRFDRHGVRTCARNLKLMPVVTGALLLSACGGGGGGVGSAGSAPPPVAPPPPVVTPPPPPPAPAPSAEYSASGAAKGAKAGYAYDRGVTGKGVTIAILDTGIDLDGPEFAGRISPDSKAFEIGIARCKTCDGETISFPLDDIQGHGTETASIALAARNGAGMQGVAPDATLLALKIVSPDLVGVTADSVIKEGDGGNSAAVAPAIAYAVDHGAFVISMSSNGSGGFPSLATALRGGMDIVRQNNRLFVQSVSNDVGRDSFAGQHTEAMVGSDLANKDWFLFGIRVDANLEPPTGNGTPGALADRTLAVVASNVMATGKDGETVTVTGNSFAAPAIAGAAALLKQYWPQLGGKEISRVLLDTATDLGAPGVDQIFGVGLMNIEKAMQAQEPTLGTSSLKSASVASTALVFSGAFGGADGSAKFSEHAGQAIVLDRYGRDYAIKVGALAAGYRPQGLQVGGVTAPVQTMWAAPALNQSAALALTAENRSAHPVRPSRSGRFGFRTSATTAVTGQVDGSIERSGLVSGAMFRTLGLAMRGSDLTVHRSGYSLSLASAADRSRYGAGRSSLTSVTLTTPHGLSLGLASAREQGSALGLTGAGAFAIEGARSTFASLGWSGEVADFQLTGEAMAGRTQVASRSAMLAFADPVLSSGFRLQADHMAFGGIATLGLTSPLKVERATLRYTAPVAYDLASRELVTETRAFGIAPDAREMNVELGWSAALSENAAVRLGLARAFNAGHVAGARDTAGSLSVTLR